MEIRSTVGKTLLLLAVPVVFLGLIDPLEGGLALVAATVIYVLAFWLLRRAPSRWLWIPFLGAFVLGVSTLLLAVIGGREEQIGPLPPLVIIGLWLYRAAVVAALVGALVTIRQAFFAARRD
jgi:hypothetical protein